MTEYRGAKAAGPNLATQSDLLGGSLAYDSWVYGDGSDGAVVLDGVNTYAWATLSGSSGAWVYTLLRDVYANSLSVPSGTRLATTNYRVFCRTLSGSGTISNNGNPSLGSGSGGPAFASGTLPANQAGAGTLATTSALTNSVGGRGGQGGQGVGTAVPAVAGAVTVPTAANGGLQILKLIANVLEARIQASVTRFSTGTGGSGGNGDTGSNASGGGASGGILVLCAAVWTFSGTVSALGGNSVNAGLAAGTTAGTGGSGGGGCVAIVTRQLTRTSQTLNANDRIEAWQSVGGQSVTLNASSGTVGTPIGGGVAGSRGGPGNISVLLTAT